MRAIAVLLLASSSHLAMEANADPVPVVLLMETPLSHILQVNQPMAHPMSFRVVREDNGLPVAGVDVTVGLQCFEFSCPAVGYFWGSVLGAGGPVTEDVFRSGCDGRVRTTTYTAGDHVFDYQITAEITSPFGVDGVNFAPGSGSRAIQISQIATLAPIVPAPAIPPREFCGVTDLRSKCGHLAFINGFEEGSCGK